MKAIVQDTYGSADVLRLDDVDRPAVGPDDVLIRVHAAGVDAGVWHLMAGRPFLMRAMGFGVRGPRARTRGLEVAGVVEAVGAQVTALRGEGTLEEVEIDVDGETVVRPAQSLVAALGFVADLGPMQQWGLDVEKRHIVVDPSMRTNLPRVFAAGDITEYPGKVRLIAVGFGEAATAVNNATVAIDPSAKVFPGHSSEGS